LTRTGRTRYRIGRTLFGRQYLVLQEEVKYAGFYEDYRDNTLVWLDVTPQDLIDQISVEKAGAASDLAAKFWPGVAGFTGGISEKNVA
jgi:hypothetical protein